MMKLFLIFIFVSFSNYIWADCSEPDHKINRDLIELESRYQIFYDGASVTCDLKCFDSVNCTNQCQQKLALKSFKNSLSEQEIQLFQNCPLNSFLTELTSHLHSI